MASSSSRLGKQPISVRREADPFGWFSDDNQRTDFICNWGFKEVLRHKCINIAYYKNEGFKFQEWLERDNLTKFVELQGECYPNLVKVFYCNLRREGNRLLSRVKGVDIVINNTIRENAIRLRNEGLSLHHGIAGYDRQGLYNTMLRKPAIAKCLDDFNIKNLLTDECIYAYVMTWKLLPREDDHSLLTDEDIYQICALSSSIQTNWTFVVRDHMMKFTKSKGLCLSYGVLISKILKMQKVNITNVRETQFLDSVGITKLRDEWTMVDDIPSTFEMDPLKIDAIGYKFHPLSIFEGHVDRRFDRLENKLNLMQKSLSDHHKKMDYALRIKTFEESSVGDTDSGITLLTKRLKNHLNQNRVLFIL